MYELLTHRERSSNSNNNVLVWIKHLFISSSQHLYEVGGKDYSFIFTSKETETRAGFFYSQFGGRQRQDSNLKFQISCPMVFPWHCVSFASSCPSKRHTIGHVHTHTPVQVKCRGLICLTTNLKAIYVFYHQTKGNYRLNICDSRSIPVGDYFIFKTEQSCCPQSYPRRKS